MKVFRLDAPGVSNLAKVPEAEPKSGEVLSRVRVVEVSGTDLNTFRGRNGMGEFSGLLGHEIAAEVVFGAGIDDPKFDRVQGRATHYDQYCARGFAHSPAAGHAICASGPSA